MIPISTNQGTHALWNHYRSRSPCGLCGPRISRMLYRTTKPSRHTQKWAFHKCFLIAMGKESPSYVWYIITFEYNRREGDPPIQTSAVNFKNKLTQITLHPQKKMQGDLLTLKTLLAFLLLNIGYFVPVLEVTVYISVCMQSYCN